MGLYYWSNYVDLPGVNKILTVNMPSVILAVIVAVASLITYIWVPKKSIFPFTFTIYTLMLTMSASLVISTGDSMSPFITLWILLGFFAGIFGIWGLLPIFIATFVFIAFQYINARFKNETIIIVALSSFLPVIASMLIWRSKSGKDELNNDNRAYRSLANELSEVASKSEVVINAIGDGVIAINNQGVIQLINPTAQQILGWGKQDAMALNYRSVMQLVNQKDESLDDASDPIRQALNINQQIRTNNLALITKSGKKLMISLVVSPVGEVGSGVIIVFHDVTKEKAEEREQAEFISTASHEMRTPVASIEGYLGLAVNPQTAQIDDRAKDFIQKAQASAQHLGHLFQDLLDVSKADDGRIANNPKVVDIVKFTNEIVQGLKPKASEKGLRLIYKPIPDDTKEKIVSPVYYVNLDNDHIREILDNLIENAIKYTPKGDVVVDIDGDDDHVVILIKDSGIGIPVEDMPHLFQKFYRVDNKNTRDIGGTGLGLYLSRRLSEIMGGRIWAESSYGKGSTFFVELPRITSQAADLLIEQATFRAKQEADQLASNQPQQPIQAIQMDQPSMNTQQTSAVNEPPRSVPRGQALTPEQIAAYVAKQRELASQQQVVSNQPQPQIQPPIQPAQSPNQTTMQPVLPPRPQQFGTAQPINNRPGTISIPDRRI